MPIYEYQCESCGHEFEIIQKISDPRLTDCPECKLPSLRKKVSAAAFRLKGGGWYETDFKTGDKKNVAGEKAADDKTKSADGGDKGKSGEKGDKKEAKKEASTAGTDSKAGNKSSSRGKDAKKD